MKITSFPSPLEKLNLNVLDQKSINLWVKRDDLLHNELSGNKLRKLRLNVDHILSSNYDQIITFGGAFSNHLLATAFVAKETQINSIGIVRGERPKKLNETLFQCENLGMQFEFISREDYKNKGSEEFLKALNLRYPNGFVIPEGGANELGVQGCEAIVTETKNQIDFDYISVDCGTGATLAGMVRELNERQKAIGVQVLKGADFISDEVEKWSPNLNHKFEVWTNYHFGGYAKYHKDMVDFMRWFYIETSIKLDPIYTAKQFYAIFDQISKDYFPINSKIVIVHTGGLQGISGFEERYKLSIYD